MVYKTALKISELKKGRKEEERKEEKKEERKEGRNKE